MSKKKYTEEVEEVHMKSHLFSNINGDMEQIYGVINNFLPDSTVVNCYNHIYDDTYEAREFPSIVLPESDYKIGDVVKISFKKENNSLITKFDVCKNPTEYPYYKITSGIFKSIVPNPTNEEINKIVKIIGGGRFTRYYLIPNNKIGDDIDVNSFFTNFHLAFESFKKSFKKYLLSLPENHTPIFLVQDDNSMLWGDSKTVIKVVSVDENNQLIPIDIDDPEEGWGYRRAKNQVYENFLPFFSHDSKVLLVHGNAGSSVNLDIDDPDFHFPKDVLEKMGNLTSLVFHLTDDSKFSGVVQDRGSIFWINGTGHRIIRLSTEDGTLENNYFNESIQCDQKTKELESALEDLKKYLRPIVQDYIGMTPSEKGCNNWNEVQEQMLDRLIGRIEETMNQKEMKS